VIASQATGRGYRDSGVCGSSLTVGTTAPYRSGSKRASKRLKSASLNHAEPDRDEAENPHE
jgi:hypothetical protein